MVGVSFIYPKFLFFFFLVPVFIIIYFFNLAHNRKKAIIFSNFESLEKIPGIEFFSRNFLALYLNLAILALLILAISGITISIDTKSDPYSYVVAIDNSDSMRTSDVLPTRLDVAKEFSSEFIDALPIGIKIGIISFSGSTEIVHELETSKVKLKASMDSIDFSLSYGTNLYNTMVLANKLLENEKYKSVLVISDGQFNLVDIPQAVKYAQKNNIFINTILVGTEEGGNLTEFDTVLRADETSLQSLASDTGGKFFDTQGKGLEKSVKDSLIIIDTKISLNFSIYLIMLAIVLFFINWILYNFKFSVLP